MTRDIIIAGVGGQGVLSAAAIIAAAASIEGLHLRQSEVHGMAQRGGAVVANLRMSDKPICSDLIPLGSADLILSLEPLESLRYAPWLSPGGALISASKPFKNIPNYPDINTIYDAIKCFPVYKIIDAEKTAKEAGFPKSVNIVMAGAASAFLPLKEETLFQAIAEIFKNKGTTVIEANKKAFILGRAQSG